MKTGEGGFSYAANVKRSTMENIPKIENNVFIEGLYKISDYQWIIDIEKKW